MNTRALRLWSSLSLLAALSLAGPAVAQDAPAGAAPAGEAPAAGAEAEAPKFLLAEVGVRIDHPEEGWKNDHWSEWDLKSTSKDGVILLGWTTPYQVDIKAEEAASWGQIYINQAVSQGGIDPKVVVGATRDFRGTVATDYELTMGTTENVELTMYSVGFPVDGQTFHLATVAMSSKKEKAKEELEGALERLEVKAPAGAPTWGGVVNTVPGLETTLDGYWRVPHPKERDATLRIVQSLGVQSIKGCWFAVHPRAGAQADVLLACQDKKRVYPIVDSLTFGDQQRELGEAYLGDQAPPAEVITLADRIGFHWKGGKVGSREIFLAAVPNQDGMVKLLALPAEGVPAADIVAAGLATTNAQKFSLPKPAPMDATVQYYLRYNPTSPVVLGPIAVAIVVFIGICGLILFGLQRQNKQAREEM
jgi:hypothetical protein